MPSWEHKLFSFPSADRDPSAAIIWIPMRVGGVHRRRSLRPVPSSWNGHEQTPGCGIRKRSSNTGKHPVAAVLWEGAGSPCRSGKMGNRKSSEVLHHKWGSPGAPQQTRGIMTEAAQQPFFLALSDLKALPSRVFLEKCGFFLGLFQRGALGVERPLLAIW